MTLLCNVASTNFMAGRWAPATARPRGTPWPAVKGERLVPPLPRSVGLGPVFFPAQRGLGHRPIQRLPFPVQADLDVKRDQPLLPESPEHAHLRPGDKAIVDRAARSQAVREGFPLATGPQHVEDRFERLARGHPGSPAFGMRPLRGQQRRDPLPPLVRDAILLSDLCLLGHHPPPFCSAEGAASAVPVIG
jgi:hypothetical protein